MIKVRVRYFGLLREITGKKEENVYLEGNIEIGDLLEKLTEEHGKKFKRYIFAGHNEVRESLIFLLNKKNLVGKNILNHLLSDEDTLSILLPIAGG